MNNIVYIETCKPYIVLHYFDGSRECRRESLTNFEKENSFLFYRAGRKYLVNMEYVKGISEFLILDNGSRLRISKDAKTKLRVALKEYRAKNNK